MATQKKSGLRGAWSRLPKAWRIEIMSVLHTFVAAFAAVMVLFVQSAVDSSWTRETLMAAVAAAFLAALRAGVKAVSIAVAARLFPVRRPPASPR